MRVWLDPQRMASYGLTVQDVENAIRLANAEIPGGRVEGSGREFAVRVDVQKVWSGPGDTFFAAAIQGDGLPGDLVGEKDEILLRLNVPGWEGCGRTILSSVFMYM